MTALRLPAQALDAHTLVILRALIRQGGSAETVLTDAILDTLMLHQRDIFRWAQAWNKEVVAADVAGRFDMTMAAASKILSALVTAGLMKRKERREGTARHYVYEVA